MKMTLKNIVACAFMISLVTACKIDEIKPYDINDSAVVFASTSTAFSLKGVADPEVAVTIPVDLVGVVADYDREISFEIIEDENNNAVYGTDFFIDEAKIPAGEIGGSIKLRLINNLDENTSQKNTVIKLLPNEHFRKGYDSYSSSNVSWSEEYVRPELGVWRYWYMFVSRYYSRNLHEFLVSEFGEDIERTTGHVQYVRENPDLIFRAPGWWYGVNRQLRSKVQEYDNAHPDAPLMHSNDCMSYRGYDTANGNGQVPDPIPTILETLTVI